MKSFKGVAFAVAAIALVAAAQAGAAGPTTVSNVYTVSGLTVPGVDTGLVLRTGRSVTVTATGAVCPFGNSFCPGPGGYGPWDTTQSGYGGFVLPGAPAWGLVGRVGNGPWVQVGSGPTVLTGTGALVFAVNDDLLDDNAGSFTVTVSRCWPGWGYGDENHDHCGPPGLAVRAATSGVEQGKANANGNGNATGNGNGDGGANANASASGSEKGNGNPDPGSQRDERQGHGKNGKGNG